MIKTFSLVLDLLGIPFTPKYIDLAQKIIDNPNHKIISFCDKGALFLNFQKFILGQISQEEFVAFGDSFGDLYKYQNNPIYAKEALAYGLKNHQNNYLNSFIICYTEDKSYIEKSIQSLESILKKIKSQIYYL